MCGRYALTTNPKQLAEEFQFQEAHLKNFAPRYNIAPSQPVLALVENQGIKPDLFLWGLIPSWAKDPSIGARMINARQETLAEKPSFRGSFRYQRCLIPADGFYEWKVDEAGGKMPYYIRLKSEKPFALAGLWSHWISPDGSEIKSCAIITGAPNALMKPIHDRMPVLIPKENRNIWLDPANHDPKMLAGLLSPYPAEDMEAFPVGRAVNDPRHNTPDCLEPVASGIRERRISG